VLASVLSALWACDRARRDTEPQSSGHAEEIETTDASRPVASPACELERQRFVLLEGHWQSECLDTPIPRTSSIWTSDGHRVAVLVNEKCEDTEEQRVVVLENGVVTQTALQIERRVGRGGAIAFQGHGELIAVPGESCRVPALGLLIHDLSLGTGTVVSHRHFDRMASLWPTLATNADRISAPLALNSSFGLLSESTDTASVVYGCIHIWPINPEYADCRAPTIYFPESTGAVRNSWDSSSNQHNYFVGRGLTWAQDLTTGNMVYVAGINTPKSRALKEFVLTPFAWALHEYRTPRRLPIPPVMGDGVQLVYDGDRDQMILLDPASTRSWLLEDYRRWVPLEHEPLKPLAEQLGELEEAVIEGPSVPLRVPPARSELDAVRPPIWRNTDHIAPWFATYDLDRHAIVVYPYRPEGVFCLPVQDQPGETVCLSSHS